MKNFNYTHLISSNDATGFATFTIPNDCVLVRVRFWYSGNSDPQLGYLNFMKNIPKHNIQILTFSDFSSNKVVTTTVDVNWGTMIVTVVKIANLPANWNVGIQYYL